MHVSLVAPLLISATFAGSSDGVSDYCELYAPGHFGNWYEVAGEREMRAVLAEAKHWGFTCYGDWFDMLDCADPFSGNPQYGLGNALWDRKRAHYATAQSLGLETDLVITPNHVYTDQLRPEWRAGTSERVIGQLICPSIPEARERILQNYHELFEDLARSGVRLNAITCAPYDYGGCVCERCSPWILTFARLSLDIHRLARESHPGVALRFIGWWWSAEEHRQFAEWMDAHAPGVTRSLSLHMPYGKTGVSNVPLPKDCERHAFVHIGYAEEASPRDTYGLTGPVVAAERIEASVRELRRQGVTGVVAYSEGIFDDVNKALLASLWGERRATAREVLQAYAARYFGADAQGAEAWSDWLTPWGRPFKADARASRERFELLPGRPLDWRRGQWELKADMFAAHAGISAGGATWTPQRLAAADAFWAAQETLQRDVWGLGPQRHIFAPQFTPLPWVKSWFQQRSAATQPASVRPEQCGGVRAVSSPGGRAWRAAERACRPRP